LTYRQLFKQYKIIKRLSAIQFVAYFGAWFSNVAIYSMLIEFHASSIVISIVTAIYFIPSIILAPFSGSLVDRIDARLLMINLLLIELAMTIGFLFIGSLDDIWLLMLLLFIRMSSASIFFTSEMTLIPKLLKDDALVKANELHSIIWSFAFTIGMAIGGIVVSIFGTKISFMIDGIFFIIAITILFFTVFHYQHIKIKEKILQSIKDGTSYIKSKKQLIILIFLHGSVGLTAFDALVTLLTDYHYKYILAVPLAIGLTNAMRAFALMVGSIFISNWMTKDRLFYVFILQGLSIMIWAFIQKDFYIGLIGVFFTGFFTTTLWSYTYALLQENIDKQFLGRVLAYNEMIFMFLNIITTLFIGFMVTLVGLDIITFILGSAFIFVGFYYKKRILLWI
jgi:MFS family permease